MEQGTQHTDFGAGYQLPALRSYINGEVQVPAVDRGNALRDPNTREPLQGQLSCSPEQVETALASSAAAFSSGDWKTLRLKSAPQR